MKRAFALLLLASSGAAASPSERFGWGSRDAALAGASSADVHDHSAVALNPAALALDSGVSAGLGYLAADYAVSAASTRDVQVFEAGFVTRGHLFTLPVGAGFAVALPGGHLSELATLSPEEPVLLLDELEKNVAFVGLGAAVRPLPWLSLGGTLGYLAALQGGFRVDGTVPQPSSGKSASEAELRTSVDAKLASVRYPIAALLVEPSTALRAALIYRAAVSVEQRVHGTLSGSLDYGFVQVPAQYQFSSESVGAYLPQQLTLAASLRLGSATELLAELTWQDLSRVPSPEALTSSRVRATFPPGVMGELPPDRTHGARREAGFADRWVPRMAVQHSVEVSERSELELRSGAAYQASASEAEAAWHDSTSFELSAGAGLVWHGRSGSALKLDTHLAYFALTSDGPALDGYALSTGLSLRADFH